MARSTYIYIAKVFLTMSSSEPSDYAFTVKHELISFLESIPFQNIRLVIRVGDGSGSPDRHVYTFEELGLTE